MNASLPASLTVLSRLQRLDPRLLLLLALCGMVALFAARSGGELLLPAVVIVGLTVLCRRTSRLLALALQMRWLLLSVLLLHLLLTPGRTLFGSLLLSYDGLLRGLLVGAQLLLAAALASLLAVAGSAPGLAAALQALLSPGGLLRRPVHRFAGQVLLTLQLAPQLRADWEALRLRLRATRHTRRRWRRRLELLLQALIGHVDSLARQSAAGQDPFPALQPLPPLAWRQGENLCALLFLVAALISWWL